MAIELTWLGHGAWLIQTGEHRLLVDPFLDDSPTAPIKADQVQCDFMLVSHGHFDHISDAAKIAKRTKAKVIACYEICEWLTTQEVPGDQMSPHNLGGGSKYAFGHVKLTLAQHSSTLPDGSAGGNPCGFLLSIDGKRIYLACDTALFYDMKLIGAAGIDLAILPIGDRFTMGPDDSIEAIKLIEPKRVAPAHYNIWPPIAQDANAWADRVRKETKAEPTVIQPGEKISIV